MKFLWIFIGICDAIFRVDSQMGCSFSSDDWCNYTNVFDLENGPQWLRSKPSMQQNFEGYLQSRRSMRLHGNHPMDWPPKVDDYLYTGPTRSNTLAEKFAELKSPAIVVNDTGKCLYFNYHNRIPIKLTPTLTVCKQNVNNSTPDYQVGESREDLLVEFFSVESSKWFEAQVPLPVGEYHLIFSGKNYNNNTIEGGVLAIASISIADGFCAKTIPDWLKAPGDCGFEDDVEFCGYSYTNDSTVKLLKIIAEYLSPAEQSNRAHRRPSDDRFLAMTSKFYEIANHRSKARLLSPEISIQRPGCIYLWYYNSVQPKSDENNAFNIIQLESTIEKLLFRLPIPKTNRDRWYQLNAALPSGTYRLIFEVLYTSDFDENDYVAFDNIEIFNRSCSDVKSGGGACGSREMGNGGRLCGNGGSCLKTGKKSFRCACSDGYYGSRCEHEYRCTSHVNPCRNGGTCVPNGRLDFRCFCQSGYDGKSCEEIKRCGSPANALNNARVVSFTNETYGSTARFECIEGWIQMGNLVGSCNAQGNWDLQGVCLLPSCDGPPNFHLMTLINVTNTTYKGRARYRCQEGYTTYENQDFLTCHVDVNQYRNYYDWRSYSNVGTIQARWIRSDGSSGLGCHAIPNCGQPPTIANANVTVSSVLLYGVASYRCSAGYELNVNLSSAEFICSQHGQWMNKNGVKIQCLVFPDCGPPPKISHGYVSYKNTFINNTASYECSTGYRLIGSETAVCWGIRENRLEKWVDWLFVPKCELHCRAKGGRRGNITIAKFQVSLCQKSGFETFSSDLVCGPAVAYSVNRRQGGNPAEEDPDDRIVFYGRDLCVSEKFRRVKYYGDIIVYSSTVCVEFCFQYPFEIRDIVVRDVLRYSRVAQTGALSSSDFRVGPTSREQKIIRYVSLSW